MPSAPRSSTAPSPGGGLGRALAVALFFASGASGLIYQVTWVRRFGKVFGNTLSSAALVTAVFMCGLGVGSYLAGRWVDRRGPQAPLAGLRAYGQAELGIGLLGLGLTGLLSSPGAWLARWSSYQPGADGWHALSTGTWALYYLVAIVALALPCLLMGATLSLLIRFVVGSELGMAGWRIGVLYGLNTAGAALGALLTDFLFVPTLGVRDTQLCAVAINLAAGGGALWLARRLRPVRTGEQAVTKVAGPVRERSKPSARRLVPLTALALGLSGFAAMGLEILWFRYLSQVLGSLRATFSLMLAVMLVALGLGAAAAGWLHRRLGQPALLFMLSQALLVACAAGLLGWVDYAGLHADHLASVRASYLEAARGGRTWIELESSLRPVLLLTAAPALLMGFAFPLANAHVQRATGTVGARAGALYLANTAGNVLGSAMVGFVLLPVIGIQQSALVLLAAAGLCILPIYRSARVLRRGSAVERSDLVFVGSVLTVGVCLVLFHQLPSDRLLRPALPSTDDGTQRLLAVSEGPYETIAVAEVPGLERTLFTNGHTMSSGRLSSQRYMRAFAHIPLLQQEHPKRVLVICFGVGNTLHAASLHPTVQQLEVADLSRHVLGHAAEFAEANGGILEDPRVAVFVNDGRHHLQMQEPGGYDLVSLEPPPVFFAGVASLYSREFYQLCHSRLAPGGFVSQWLPGYQVHGSTVLAMVRAFIEVFPDAVLLSGDDRELILLGTKERRIGIDPDQLAERLRARPEVQQDLHRVQMGTPLEIVGSFVASYQTMAQATVGIEPVTDDRPLLEYSQLSGIRATTMPAALFDVTDIESWCVDCRQRISGLSAHLRLRQAIYRSSAFLRAGHFQQADEQGAPLPDDPPAQTALANSPYLQRLLGGGSFTARQVGRQHLARGQLTAAIGALRRAVYLNPADAAAFALLGRAQLAAGRLGRAAVALQRALTLDPNQADGHYDLAVLLHRRGDRVAAGAELARVVELEPKHPRASAVLCKRAADARRFDEAIARCDLAQAGGVTISPALLSRLAPHRPEHGQTEP